MFRKKDTDSEGSTGGAGILRRSVGEGAPTELPPRKIDLPAAGSGPTVGAAAPAASLPPSKQAEPDPYGGKRLIVGQGIRLSGEISSCDRLVVEGEVEVTLNDTLALEIASSGRFTGGCEVEEADISGVYEGDLTVRRRLFVRGSGKLTGTVRYLQTAPFLAIFPGICIVFAVMGFNLIGDGLREALDPKLRGRS